MKFIPSRVTLLLAEVKVLSPPEVELLIVYSQSTPLAWILILLALSLIVKDCSFPVFSVFKITPPETSEYTAFKPRELKLLFKALTKSLFLSRVDLPLLTIELKSMSTSLSPTFTVILLSAAPSRSDILITVLQVELIDSL